MKNSNIKITYLENPKIDSPITRELNIDYPAVDISDISIPDIENSAFDIPDIENTAADIPDSEYSDAGMTAEDIVIGVLLNRHSYRGEYEQIPVPRKDLIQIMQAGLAAPSGCNMQTTSLIAVDDPEILKSLRAIINKPVGSTAPAMICVLTQHLPSYHGRCFAVQDYSAAIENMLLAIVALGYQSCWVEGYITDSEDKCRQITDLLGIPAGYDPVCCLPVGIAVKEPSSPKKKPFEERAWFNSFPKK